MHREWQPGERPKEIKTEMALLYTISLIKNLEVCGCLTCVLGWVAAKKLSYSYFKLS